jgi:hypothetical protein
VTRLIRIVGVGAHLPTGGPRGRVQRLPRGWQGELPDDLAVRWVDGGVAVLVGDDASEQEVSIPGGSAAEPKAIAGMTAKELRAFAAAHDPVIEIPSSVKKVADVRTLVAEALATTVAQEPTEGDADVLPDPLPEDLADLTEEQLLALAVEWELDVPEDTDRDQLLALVKAHDADSDDGDAA